MSDTTSPTGPTMTGSLPGPHLVEVADAHGLGEHLFELRGVPRVGSPGEIVVVILTGGPPSIADDVRRVILVAHPGPH